MLDGEFGPVAEGVAVFVKIAAPAGSRRRRAHFMRVLRQGACAPVRAIGLSDGVGVEVRLYLKDG